MVELISVHVPKTAGTSFSNVLTQVYGVERIHKDYEGADLNTVRPEHRVIHGHFSVAKYHGLYPTARRIAWIRHPVARLISFYYYAQSIERQPGNPVACRLKDEDLSLLDYVEHPLMRNHYARQYFYGLAIEDFFFVGIHEHFRDDLRDLSRRMDWPRVEVGNDNANPDPAYWVHVARYQRDRALQRRIEALNERDMALYERALKARDRRLRGSWGRGSLSRWIGGGVRETVWRRSRRAS